MTGNELAALVKTGYGIAAIFGIVASVLFIRLEAARDRTEAVLREVLPLAAKLPDAVESLHQLADKLRQT